MEDTASGLEKEDDTMPIAEIVALLKYLTKELERREKARHRRGSEQTDIALSTDSSRPGTNKRQREEHENASETETDSDPSETWDAHASIEPQLATLHPKRVKYNYPKLQEYPLRVLRKATDDTDGSVSTFMPSGHVPQQRRRFRLASDTESSSTESGGSPETRKQDPQKEFFCAIGDCRKGFSTRYTRDRHIRRIHEQERMFVCETESCRKRFFSRYERKEHAIKMHPGVKPFVDKPFECTFCDEAFISTHTRNLHEEEHLLEDV